MDNKFEIDIIEYEDNLTLQDILYEIKRQKTKDIINNYTKACKKCVNFKPNFDCLCNLS